MSASRVLAVCCGQTEKAYFDGLRRLTPSVTLKPEVKVGSPVQRRERDPGGFDEFWCVVDVDDFDIDEAVVAAKSARISMAVSNPCFELWLILHFNDCTAELSGAKEAVARLRKCLPRYEKSGLDFATFAGGVADAMERAKSLEAKGLANPSTGVWRLVELVLSR